MSLVTIPQVAHAVNFSAEEKLVKQVLEFNERRGGMGDR